MPWGVAAAAVAAYGSMSAADKASEAQTGAANKSIAEQRRQFDTLQRNTQPYLRLGESATDRLARLQAGDFSGFTESPDYQFALQQGLQGVQRGQAARGALDSGGASADLMRFGQGLASQQYGDYWNRLYNQAIMGQNAAVQQGSQGMQMASNIGNAYGSAANAQGQAAMNQANALGNFAQNAANIYGQYRAQQYNPYSYQNNPNYIGGIQRETFTPDTSIQGYEG